MVIERGKAGGIQIDTGSGPGTITHNVISDTNADGIHMTNGAHSILVEGNRTLRVGDDGVAVVSPRSGKIVWGIVARNNVIRDSTHGRGISVVGGRGVLYENNTIENIVGGGACVYIAQEESYATFGSHAVLVRRNTMRNCPQNDSAGHGSIMVFSDGYEPNSDLVFSRNLIVNDGPGQSNVLGVRMYGDNVNVQFLGNLISGPRQMQIDTPGVTVAPFVTSLPVGDPGR